MTEPGGDIVIRDLVTHDEYLACVRLQDETWGNTFSERVPPAILRVSQKIGGVCAGAFDRSAELIGFVFGMTGLRDGRLVHWSDMLAVRDAYRGRHIGRALKDYQAEKVRALGVETMLWTYDPLVAANAHFNINRLGARPIEYVPDMYGSNTGSALHGTLPTDRFIVSWDLTRGPRAEGRGESDRVDDEGSEPLPFVRRATRAEPLSKDQGQVERVEIPPDLAALQQENPDEARRWRFRVRDEMRSLLAKGYRVTGFVRVSDTALPHYVLTPPA